MHRDGYRAGAAAGRDRDGSAEGAVIAPVAGTAANGVGNAEGFAAADGRDCEAATGPFHWIGACGAYRYRRQIVAVSDADGGRVGWAHAIGVIKCRQSQCHAFAELSLRVIHGIHHHRYGRLSSGDDGLAVQASKIGAVVGRAGEAVVHRHRGCCWSAAADQKHPSVATAAAAGFSRAGIDRLDGYHRGVVIVDRYCGVAVLAADVIGRCCHQGDLQALAAFSAVVVAGREREDCGALAGGNGGAGWRCGESRQAAAEVAQIHQQRRIE